MGMWNYYHSCFHGNLVFPMNGFSNFFLSLLYFFLFVTFPLFSLAICGTEQSESRNLTHCTVCCQSICTCIEEVLTACYKQTSTYKIGLPRGHLGFCCERSQYNFQHTYIYNFTVILSQKFLSSVYLACHTYS